MTANDVPVPDHGETQAWAAAAIERTRATPPTPDPPGWVAQEMANLSGECGNCGAIDQGLVPCRNVWHRDHTHPRSHGDLTPEPCRLMLCGRCQRMVRRNLARLENGRPSNDGWRNERMREGAVKRLNAARQQVMRLYGGNLDHPALDHIEAAMQSIEQFRPMPQNGRPSDG